MVQCTRCGVAKPETEFAKDATLKRGRKSWCKECDNQRARDYYQRNRDKRRAYDAARYATRREYLLAYRAARYTPAPPRHIVCADCHRTVTASRHGPNQQRCQDCKAIHERQRHKNRTYHPKPNVVAARPCAQCGNDWVSKRGVYYAHKRTCPKCRTRARHIKACARAAPAFHAIATGNIPTTPLLCSGPPITTGAPKRRGRPKNASPPATAPRLFTAGRCPECNTTFVGLKRDRYCSADCTRKGRRRLAKHSRDKRIRGRKREAISLPKLATRDAWRCHLCGKRVTRSNWSIDHLIPLSDPHGTHTWDNVALAHHRCNSLRSNKGAAQLLLIGT